MMQKIVVLHSAGQIVYKLSAAMTKIGAFVLTVMMLLTAADVFLRYIFNKPILGAFELTQFMMVILFGCGAAYCTITRTQINVDLLVSRLTPQARRIVGSITSLISFGVVSLLASQVCIQIKLQYQSNAISSALEIPEFPFVAVLAFGLILLAVAELLQLFKYIFEVSLK